MRTENGSDRGGGANSELWDGKLAVADGVYALPDPSPGNEASSEGTKADTTLAYVVLFGIPALKRSRRAMLALLLLLASLAFGITSCGGGGGGGGNGNSGTSAGIYTITVTGASGSTIGTTTVN